MLNSLFNENNKKREVGLNNIGLLVIFSILSTLNTGCVSKGDVEGRKFEFSSVVKNDIDLVTETHQTVVFEALKQLATKLYKRNPQEWKKEGHKSLQMAVRAITTEPFVLLNEQTSAEQIRLSFDETYQGDRVKAYIVGLETMILASYDNHRSFYFYHMLDAQKLYDSARNLELASWLIRTKHKSNGELFLLSSAGSDELNLSFERLFGKIINAQDMIAQITADRSHRQIKNVIQSLATAFIPI